MTILDRELTHLYYIWCYKLFNTKKKSLPLLSLIYLKNTKNLARLLVSVILIIVKSSRVFEVFFPKNVKNFLRGPVPNRRTNPLDAFDLPNESSSRPTGLEGEGKWPKRGSGVCRFHGRATRARCTHNAHVRIHTHALANGGRRSTLGLESVARTNSYEEDGERKRESDRKTRTSGTEVRRASFPSDMPGCLLVLSHRLRPTSPLPLPDPRASRRQTYIRTLSFLLLSFSIIYLSLYYFYLLN